MDSLIKPRPNHYELLGLTPTATDEEIASAFARQISPLTPHAFGDIALLSVAHETLRDPARRRAYDEAHGLNARPKAVKPVQGWQYKTTVRVAGPVRPEAPPPAKAENPQSTQEAKPPAPAPSSPAEPRSDWIPSSLPLQYVRVTEEESGQWKRPAIVAGGIFLAVGIMGVLAGLWAARDVQSKIPAETVAFESPAEARPVAPEPRIQSPSTATPAARPARPTAPSRARQQTAQTPPVQAQEQHAEDVPEIPSEQVVALTSQADDTPAAMPLPNGVIARTIGRIGYSCGEVASTSAVDGAPGVFKVTCTSGQSYRAAPVRGRYHFRRWAG